MPKLGLEERLENALDKIGLTRSEILDIIQELEANSQEGMIVNAGHYSLWEGTGALRARRAAGDSSINLRKDPSDQALFSFIVGAYLATKYDGKLALYLEDLFTGKDMYDIKDALGLEDTKRDRLSLDDLRQRFHEMYLDEFFPDDYKEILSIFGYDKEIELCFESELKRTLFETYVAEETFEGTGLEVEEIELLGRGKGNRIFLKRDEEDEAGKYLGSYIKSGDKIKERVFKPACAFLLVALHYKLEQESRHVLSLLPGDEIMCGEVLRGLPGKTRNGTSVYRVIDNPDRDGYFKVESGKKGLCEFSQEEDAKVDYMRILILEDQQVTIDNLLPQLRLIASKYANRFDIEVARDYSEGMEIVRKVEERGEEIHMAILDRHIPQRNSPTDNFGLYWGYNHLKKYFPNALCVANTATPINELELEEIDKIDWFIWKYDHRGPRGELSLAVKIVADRIKTD